MRGGYLCHDSVLQVMQHPYSEGGVMYISIAGLPAVTSPIELVTIVGQRQSQFTGSKEPIQVGEEIIGELTADERPVYIARSLVREECRQLVEIYRAGSAEGAGLTLLRCRIGLINSWSQALSTYLSVAIMSRFAELFFSGQGLLYLSVRSGFSIVKRSAPKENDAPIFILIEAEPESPIPEEISSRIH